MFIGKNSWSVSAFVWYIIIQKVKNKKNTVSVVLYLFIFELFQVLLMFTVFVSVILKVKIIMNGYIFL